jgi:hypothetical protein
VDYLTYPKAPAARRQKLGKESDAFRIVDRVGHAFKHVGSHGRPGLHESAVVQTPSALIGSFSLGTTALNDRGGIAVRGNTQNLLPIVDEAMAFLRSKLNMDEAEGKR